MVCLSPSEFRARLRHFTTINPPAVALVSERSTDPIVGLDTYRQQMADRRAESIGKPGIYLDQSETGAGKSHADLAAFRIARRSLSIQPTHENCEEVVTFLRAMGLDAVAYPGRFTKGEDQNCWNADADLAQAMGLPPTAAVCPFCRDHKRCSESGYLAGIKRADDAVIAVATQARAIHTGLQGLAKGREFISIHEDAGGVLVPLVSIPADRLEVARDIVQRLLNDPRYLDWFGDDTDVDADGHVITSPKKAERRTAIFDFVEHLANLIDDLIQAATETDSIQSISLPNTMRIPPGTAPLLFRVSLELKADFGKKPVWPLLMYSASGHFHREGVLAHEQQTQSQGEPAPSPLAGKMIVMTRLNLPHHNATLWLSDGTGDRDLLEHAIDREIIDATPDGQLELAHEVIQYPIDITRGTSKSRAQAIIRGVLASRPTCRRVGIITHRSLTKSKLKLGATFDDRVAIVKHFHSGADRGSNEWLRAECDLIVVAGTPRVPTDEIRKLLFRCCEIDALRSDGQWGEVAWQGFTTSGKPRVIKGRGFIDPTWRKVHRSKVRANIIQAAGRARALLETGCDAVILSNEETGFPLVEPGHDVEPMTSSEAAVLSALSAAVPLMNIRDDRRCASTEDIATRCGLSAKQTRDLLNRLERRQLVNRVGQRGGWQPSDAWIRDTEPRSC